MSQRRFLLACAALAALVWRYVLSGRYFGWEESDYGNLAMVRGVLDGGFAHFDMNHLPLYYGVSALVMVVLDDAVTSARVVSMFCGVGTVVVGTVLADRVYGRRVAWTIALLLVFQPELALYSASSLREPLYALLLLSALLSLTSERMALAGLFTGLAFLTRMDALLTFGPVLAIHAFGGRRPVRRLALVLGPLVITVLGWSLYCGFEHGTYAFWEHSVAVNVETGSASEDASTLGRWLGGAGVSWSLFTSVLAPRMGWIPWLGLMAGLAMAPWNRHGARRTVCISALTMVAFWLGIGFIAQHEPGHNLYWKWLHAVMPFVFLVGVSPLWQGLDRLRELVGRQGTWILILGMILLVGSAFGRETARQLEVSARLYGPQLELAQWIEEELPEDAVLLVDNIPGCWLDRRPHERVLWTWMNVLACEDCEISAAEFGDWLLAEHIEHVLWFREEWTEAPRVAPWLGGTDTVEAGAVSLRPLRREDDYGWVFYRVEGESSD